MSAHQPTDCWEPKEIDLHKRSTDDSWETQETYVYKTQTDDSWKPKEIDLHKRPWQYFGYPAFCKWTASDNDLFVLRRFKTLNSRVLLRMQDYISQLEEELAMIDAENSRSGIPPVSNGTFREETVERREEIIIEAGSKLKEYNEYLITYSNIRSRPPADEHEISNVKNWLFHRYPNSIYPEESKYVTTEDDLIRVADVRKRSALLKVMERCSNFRQSMFSKKNPDKETNMRLYDPEATTYWDEGRTESYCRFIIIITGLVMLIAPQWWLLFVEDRRYQLGIITGFIMLFLALVAILTRAKPFESLAATAAYSAVLTVFMQVGGN